MKREIAVDPGATDCLSCAMTAIESLVTIGIPAYNRAEYLREALDSLVAQSYSNLEILVSDDASTDETPRVCEEYVRKDRRIQCFRQSRTLGIAGNHNFLLERANGKYFVWACDDDLRHQDFVKTLANLLSEYPDAVGAMCGVRHIVGGVHRIVEGSQRFDNERSSYDYLLNYSWVGDYQPISGMFVTEALRKAGGYHADSRPFFHASDYLTILRLALQGKVVYTGEPMFFKRDTGAAHSAFAVLSALRIDKGTVRLMLRYACFPVFYVYNLIFGVHSVARSDLPGLRKIRVVANLFGYYIRSNLGFGLNILRGAWALLVGCVRRIRSDKCRPS